MEPRRPRSPGPSCSLCLEREAIGTCSYCGRPACREHLEDGACTACSGALCSLCGRELSLGRCARCGRLACAGCLAQVDSVRRLCRECMDTAWMPGRGPV